MSANFCVMVTNIVFTCYTYAVGCSVRMCLYLDMNVCAIFRLW